MEPEDKVIDRFEEVFENNDPTLINTILLDSSMKDLVSIFEKKGLNSLTLANSLFILSKNDKKETKELVNDFKLKILNDLNVKIYDWVIEVAYYAMYDLATAAIAKEGFKSTTHYTTRLTLEYLYCIKGKDREKLFKIYDDVLLKRELIQNLKKAQEKREIARYKATEKLEEKDAEELLNKAKEFVVEIRKLLIEDDE